MNSVSRCSIESLDQQSVTETANPASVVSSALPFLLAWCRRNAAKNKCLSIYPKPMIEPPIQSLLTGLGRKFYRLVSAVRRESDSFGVFWFEPGGAGNAVVITEGIAVTAR